MLDQLAAAVTRHSGELWTRIRSETTHANSMINKAAI